KERVKYVPPHLGGDAGAVVRDDDFNPWFASNVTMANRHGNAATLVDCIDRIFYHGVERDPELCFVAVDFAGKLAVEAIQLNTAFLGERRQFANNFANQS